MGRFKQTVRKSTPGCVPKHITMIDNDGNISVHLLNNQKNRIEAIQYQMRRASNLITLAFNDMERSRQELNKAKSIVDEMKNIVRDMYDEEFKSDVEEIQQPEENSKQVNE